MLSDDAMTRNMMNVIRENEKLRIQVNNLQTLSAGLVLAAAVGIVLFKSNNEKKKDEE